MTDIPERVKRAWAEMHGAEWPPLNYDGHPVPMTLEALLALLAFSAERAGFTFLADYRTAPGGELSWAVCAWADEEDNVVPEVNFGTDETDSYREAVIMAIDEIERYAEGEG